MAEALKPCPFCDNGGHPKAIGGDHDGEPWWIWCDECHGCGARTDRYRTREFAVEVWNRRPLESALLTRAEQAEARAAYLAGVLWGAMGDRATLAGILTETEIAAARARQEAK